MRKLGPLPEQPEFNAKVPWTDLRDAIRIEHGLEPLDLKDVPRYNQPPIFTFEDSQEPPRKRYVEPFDLWTLNNLKIAAALIGVLIFTIFPTFSMGVLMIVFCLSFFLRRVA